MSDSRTPATDTLISTPSFSSDAARPTVADPPAGSPPAAGETGGVSTGTMSFPIGPPAAGGANGASARAAVFAEPAGSASPTVADPPAGSPPAAGETGGVSTGTMSLPIGPAAARWPDGAPAGAVLAGDGAAALAAARRALVAGARNGSAGACWGAGEASAGDLAALRDVLVAGARRLGEERPEVGLRFLAGCESRLSALKAEMVARLAERDGKGKAADLLRDGLKQSRGSAKREVKTAEGLAEMPRVGAALRNGEITAAAARLIVEAAEEAPPEAPIDEGELLDAARREPGDVFRHTVRDHLKERERRSNDPRGRRARQVARRHCSFGEKPDGMWRLFGEFDPVSAAEMNTVLMAKFEELRRNEDADNRRSGPQRLADAVKQLIAAGVGGRTHGSGNGAGGTARVDGNSGAGGTTDGNGQAPDGRAGKAANAVLVLLADYDVLARELRNLRLWDDTTLTPEEVARLAADAKIVPSLWKNKTTPLWFGQGRRHASATQRLALQIRDKRCVGCKSSIAGCEPHHIVFWEHGGKTDIDNLCLLCRSCHKHHLHRQGARITQDANGNFHLTKPGAGPGDRPAAGKGTREPEASAAKEPAVGLRGQGLAGRQSSHRIGAVSEPGDDQRGGANGERRTRKRRTGSGRPATERRPTCSMRYPLLYSARVTEPPPEAEPRPAGTHPDDINQPLLR